MAVNPPVVYIFHGEDEYTITQHIDRILSQLGDSAMAEMNTTRLDGRSTTLEALENQATTLPFLVKRRVVILTHPLTRLTSQPAREKFLNLLSRVPPAVALVLVEDKQLTSSKDLKNKKKHWLEAWGEQFPERVLLKPCPLPQGPAMMRRIQEQVKAAGGQITHEAADLLASLVGENPRLADQEIQKLLAYCNYRRPVEIEDVQVLTADQGQVDIFAMVDAIGNRNGKLASNLLHRLLMVQDAISIFGMVVRQFRLLLMLRDYLDSGGLPQDAPKVLKQAPFVINKLSQQVRQFDLPTLEHIYRRLLAIDEAAKNGEMEMGLAMHTLIAQVTR
jgi:DNA polymerase III subunit delta